MEIMWDIPLSLNCWPNQHPDIHHVRPFTSLEPKSQLTINLAPGWEFSSLPSEEGRVGSPKEDPFTVKPLTRFEKKKKKRTFPIEYWKKTKKRKKKKKESSRSRSEENKRKESFKSNIERNKKKKKVPDQRLEENKKKIYREVFGPDNMWTNI